MPLGQYTLCQGKAYFDRMYLNIVRNLLVTEGASNDKGSVCYP